MATIISSKTSGVGGLSVTGDASGVLQLASANGTTAVTIDASQNVGIGTSSPAVKLDVSGVAKASTLSLSGTTAFSAGTISQDVNWGMYFKAATAAAAEFAWVNSAGTERMRIDSTGNVSITQAAGKYTIDISGGATSIANNGTVDFPTASGMLVVNNWTNGGVTLWLCGGGSTIDVASVMGTVGSFAYNGGINGYRWTNNYGSTATVGFFFVRTRPGA